MGAHCGARPQHIGAYWCGLALFELAPLRRAMRHCLIEAARVFSLFSDYLSFALDHMSQLAHISAVKTLNRTETEPNRTEPNLTGKNVMKYTAETIIYDLSRIAPETRAAILASRKFRKWFSHKPDAMLRLDGSTKVIKGNKLGFRTAILYLAPYTMSGTNICANAALAQCFKACLKSAGRGAMQSVEMSRLRKTLFFLQYREEAIAMIKREIAVFEKRAAKQNFVLLVRLNGTSDVRWENYGIMQAFPAVQFYDYTKLANRKNVPANYDLTFSYSGVPGFQKQVDLAVNAGMRLAVVFRKRDTVEHMLANNESFRGLAVVDGDDTDVRHIDPQASAVALYAKGAAKRDYTGFVVG